MNLLRLAFTLRKTLSLAISAAGDARVPRRLKLLAVAGAIFILSPLNVLGDIPLVGFLDDAALLAFVANWFVRSARPYVETFEGGTLPTTR